MFESLGEKLDAVFRRLRGHGALTEKNIDEALREVRLALLEADVNFRVVKDFVEGVKGQALGQEVLASLSPGQQVIKIVHNELVELLGGQSSQLDLAAPPPAVLMLVGLNGSGKTTSAGKLARYLKLELKRSPYLIPADIQRPAAIDQLRIIAADIGVAVHPTPTDGSATDPVVVAKEGIEAARRQGYDTAIIDTAGRLQIDEELMAELERMKAVMQPHQILFVADAMTGQEAVNVASGFHNRLNLDGVILTKVEGDARGGAALSLRAVTGKPILFIGVGEKLDAFETFYPDRAASRILGMGDMLSLIEKAEKIYDRSQAEALQKKLRRNDFDLEDFREQLRAVKKMGAVSELLGMIPGMKKMLRGADLSGAEDELKRVEAIIDSMTRAERKNIQLLNASRRKRIARGSGTSVADVNRLINQFTHTKKVLKQLGSGATGPRIPGLPGLPR